MHERAAQDCRSGGPTMVQPLAFSRACSASMSDTPSETPANRPTRPLQLLGVGLLDDQERARIEHQHGGSNDTGGKASRSE